MPFLKISVRYFGQFEKTSKEDMDEFLKECGLIDAVGTFCGK